MLGVMFGSKHSFHDLGLWLKKYPEITPPSPKTRFVDVPGADSALNMSKVLTGRMQYNRRTIKMEFSIMGPREHWPQIHGEILDLLHGQEMELLLDDDMDFCYTGLLSVSGFDPQKVTSGVTIIMDAEPYRTRMQATQRIIDVSGSYTAAIEGGKKPVCPTITASTEMRMIFGSVSYSLADGENVFPDVIMYEGRNVFEFIGNGSVTLAYREGRF